MEYDRNLVDRRTIAKRLGVTPVTVRQWQHRDLGFPSPAKHANQVKGSDLVNQNLYAWDEVEQWAMDTGRLDYLVGIPTKAPTYRPKMGQTSYGHLSL